MERSGTLIAVAALSLMTLSTGCDSNGVGSADDSSITLSIKTVNSGVAAKNGNAVVDVTLAKVLLRTIQFHARGLDENTEGVDFQSDPMVAVLDPLAAPFELPAITVPEGTYHKISFRIHKPDLGEIFDGHPEFNDGDAAHERFSVIAEGNLGSVDPATFVYRSEKAMQQQVTFEEDLEIESGGGDVNVILEVDLATWFTDLDPMDTSASNTSMIDKSIRESFRIFKDNN